MTTRRGTARRPTTAMRPRLTWRQFFDDSGLVDVVGGTNQIRDLGTVGPAPDLSSLGVIGDYTIRRLRYELSTLMATTETIPEGVPLFYGVIVVNQDAFGSGAGALPSPSSDAADWMSWGVILTPADPNATGQVTDAMRFVTVDNRSMRKVNENSQVIALVLETLVGFTIRVNYAGRLLVSHGRM